MSDIVCECLGQTADRGYARSCPSNEERAYAVHLLTIKNDILFRGSLEKNELTWVSGPRADPVKKP